MTDPAIDVRDMRFGWQPGTPMLEIPRFGVEPHGGAVRLLGQDLAALSRSGRDAFRAERLGFIFQLFNLVPYLSVLENVLLPLRFSGKRRTRVVPPANDAAMRGRRHERAVRQSRPRPGGLVRS
jgi:putative ABC transport system ATP-binding protein